MSSKIDSKGNGKNEARGRERYLTIQLWCLDEKERIKEEKETWK